MIHSRFEVEIIEEYILEFATNFITEPVLFLKVAKTATPDSMSPQALYDATRKSWRISPKRAMKAKYVFAIHNNTVLEVYEPQQWYLALSNDLRLAFEGVLAPIDIRNKYIGKEIPELKDRQNPATTNFSID